MITPILSNFNLQNKINSRKPTFCGTNSVVQKYVKPIDEKHLPMLDKIGDFFNGLKDIFKAQYKPLSTNSGVLKVSNEAEPIPEALLDFGASKHAKLTPKRFRISDVKLDLCHVEYNDSNKIHKFDIIFNKGVKSPKKGDVFAYNSHRADKSPIRESEVNVINKFFERYSDDISSIIKKYQKKLS